MDTADVLSVLGISLGLGFLVGLQRQRAAVPVAGIRTFPLITVLGTVAALLQQAGLGPWIVPGAFVGITVLAVHGNLLLSRKPPASDDEAGPGVTTEVAMLLMYAVGAYVAVGNRAAAVALGGIVVILLHLKEPLHTLTERIGRDEFHAIMRFVFISMVVLPVLPNQAYGPYAVLNPFKLWLMVVLIVAISLVGYVAHRMLGARAGLVLTGLLGGIVSSTATTVSYARLAAESVASEQLPAEARDTVSSQTRGDRVGGAAFVILAATAVSMVRVIILVSVLAPTIIGIVAPPLGALVAVMSVITLFVFLARRDGVMPPRPMGNPAELRPALIFGALFAVMLLATSIAKEAFSTKGVFAVAGLSGLVDLDAITVSTSQLAQSQGLDPRDAWRAILVATMANLVFKLCVVGVIGPRELLRRIALAMVVIGGAAAALFFFWP